MRNSFRAGATWQSSSRWPSTPPPLMHPPSSAPHTLANSAATGWKATALRGEIGRLACLLSMVFFAMAGLVVRLVRLFRALCSSTMRDGMQGARGSPRGISQPGNAQSRVDTDGWVSHLSARPSRCRLRLVMALHLFFRKCIWHPSASGTRPSAKHLLESMHRPPLQPGWQLHHRPVRHLPRCCMHSRRA